MYEENQQGHDLVEAAPNYEAPCCLIVVTLLKTCLFQAKGERHLFFIHIFFVTFVLHTQKR